MRETGLGRYVEDPATSSHDDSAVPLEPGWQRIITGFSCDRGTVESLDDMRTIKAAMDEVMKRNPNMADDLAQLAFRAVKVQPSTPHYRRWRKANLALRKRAVQTRREVRSRLRIGMPRVLGMYSHAPFFMGYFQSLGLRPENLVFSQPTNEKMYKEGAKRGAIDPCFPSKVCISHVHDLLFRIHKGKDLDCIFFPMMDSIQSPLRDVKISRTCPTLAITPEAVKAAFTRESDLFTENGLVYLNPLLNMDNPALLRRQMLNCFRSFLKLDRFENDRAVKEGLKALQQFEQSLGGVDGRLSNCWRVRNESVSFYSHVRITTMMV